MRAYQIVEWGAPLEEREVPMPEPQGTEVLVRVTASGICHSDIHIWDGYFDLGGGNKLTLEDRGVGLPFTMGHEVLGEVAALGPEAEGVAVGDRRIVFPWIGCGDCAVCQRGEELLCLAPRTVGARKPGGYAEYCLAPHPRYLVDFEGVDEPHAATCACSGVTAYSALRKVDFLRADEHLMIIGAGGVGLAGIGMAKAVVKGKLVVADIDPAKRAAAIAAGADEVVDNGDGEAVAKVLEMTGGGAMAAIDFVGAPATGGFAVQALARGGTLVVVGLFGGAMPLPMAMMPLKMLRLIGSYVGNLQEMHELMALVKAGKVKPVPITPRPLREAGQAIADLRDGKAVGRYVLTN
ncbi:MAG: alcohol dehydrogenase [Alphaproteobacteria bacterium]|jgi:D-arabinose 1-dehydrogenase-like Zn-dependent alcohol dehydrogenase|nr:alcohol dehydrogenase [Alphaproteobacteria bacterium]MDP6813644.1 alcohol dehydrogenase [Alphaproteobacteria bacterium]